MSTTVDTCVVGGGPGGYVAALTAAQTGADVVLVERGELGGVCLNEGCVPSKALIHAGRRRREDDHADEMGLPSGGGAVDHERLQDWKDGMVGRLRDGVGHLLRRAGVEVVQGEAVVRPGGVVEVAGGPDRTLRADTVVLATGTEPVDLPVLPVDGETVVGSRGALEVRRAVDRLVVVGGGYIGVELAGAHTDLGADVVVVELEDRLLPSMPRRLSTAAERGLRQRGVDVRTGTAVVGRADGGVRVRTADGDDVLAADLVVVAVGREPALACVDAEVGLELDPDGRVRVDAARRTSVSGLLAIGDITPGPALAHAAMQEGVVAGRVAAGVEDRFDPLVVPAVVYTTPEIATVGMDERAARRRGIPVRVEELPMTGNARSLTLGQATGSVALVVEDDTGVVLGAQLEAVEAGELVATLGLAIELGAVAEDLHRTVFPHPSVSEVVGELGGLALGIARHAAP